MNEKEIINKLVVNFINDSLSLNFKKNEDDIKIDITGSGDNVLLAYMLIGKKIFKKVNPTKKHLELYNRAVELMLEYIED